LERVCTDGLIYYRFARWPLVHGVFTRLGGVSRPPWASLNLGSTVGDDPRAVQRNHELIWNALRLDGARACTVWQVHGADAVVATPPPVATPNGWRWLARADGLVTDRPGLPLVMRFADCVPIFLYDSVRGAIGLAHAGWRGTVAGVGPSTVHAMQRAFGSQPADIWAGLGPSIGPECYRVGVEVVAAVRGSFGDVEGLVGQAEDGSAHLDLWAANRLALERAGVEQIEVAGLCTACHTDEFYSHRAERGRTGRFGAVLALP
jgi:YfiH family protein